MITLGDFFKPLNFSNMTIFLAFVFLCEVTGYRLITFFTKDIPFFLRGSVWIIGLGIVVFTFFTFHFFVPFNSPLILIALLTLFAVSIPFYARDRAWRRFGQFLKNNKLPLVVILLVLPKVVIKSSLPPYIWDEMAYHYISPSTLYLEKIWTVNDSFYQNLPRLLETAYIALFSLTKTYSVARFLHFTIFVTFLLTAYSFFKKEFGVILAFVFFVFTIFHPERFLLWSTFGYVDIGTMSFVLIALLAFLDYLFSGKINRLIFSFAFFGLAAGTKYSALTQLAAFIVIFIIILFFKKSLHVLKSKKVLIYAFLFLIMGGYWYVKNLALTGNPTYPFLFGCRFEKCDTVSLAYTNTLIFANIPVIYKTFFLGNKSFEILLPLSIVISLLFGQKKVKVLVLSTLVFVAVEVLIVKNISGYETRYFYHWLVFTVLLLAAPFSIFKRHES